MTTIHLKRSTNEYSYTVLIGGNLFTIFRVYTGLSNPNGPTGIAWRILRNRLQCHSADYPTLREARKALAQYAQFSKTWVVADSAESSATGVALTNRGLDFADYWYRKDILNVIGCPFDRVFTCALYLTGKGQYAEIWLTESVNYYSEHAPYFRFERVAPSA